MGFFDWMKSKKPDNMATGSWITLLPDQGEIISLFKQELHNARLKGERPFLLFSSSFDDGSTAIRKFRKKMAEAYAGVYIIECMMTDWDEDELKKIGFIGKFPYFAQISKDGSFTGEILTGDVWGEDTLVNMKDPITRFLQGAYVGVPMSDEIKQEVLEQINRDVKYGLESEYEIVEGIMDMFYTEENIDKDWIRFQVSLEMQKHKESSLNWMHPTDFEKLAEVFDELTRRKIVCLHKAGYTRQDAEDDCAEVMQELNERGVSVRGYAYYHTQDLERAIDPDVLTLMIGFDSADGDDAMAIEIAKEVAESLKQKGFQIKWSGSVKERIEIKPFKWQKVYDETEWGYERALNILAPEE